MAGHPRSAVANPRSQQENAGERVAGVGLILAGRGSFAAYEAGVISTLVSHGHVPYFISWTSMGAINAAIIVSGPQSSVPERLHAAWRDLSGTSEPSSALLRDVILRYVDFASMHDQRFAIAVSLREVTTGHLRIVTNTYARLLPEHIIACAFAPPTATPIDGELYWDSGHFGGAGLLAMGFLLQRVEERCPVFLTRFVEGHAPTPTTEGQLLARMAELQAAWQFGLWLEPDLLERIASEKRQTSRSSDDSGALNYRWLSNLHQVPIAIEPLVGPLDYSPGVIERRIRAGSSAAIEFLGAYEPRVSAPLPADSGEAYSTFLAVPGDFPLLEVISIPLGPAVDWDAVRLAGNLQRTDSLDQVRDLIAKMLATPSSDGTRATTDSAAAIQVADAVVHEMTIPMAQSPLRSWTVAGLMGIATTVHVGGMVDVAQAPVLILEVAGSLVALGAANVLRQTLEGFSKGLSKATEHAGEQWANAIFEKWGWPVNSPRKRTKTLTRPAKGKGTPRPEKSSTR
jgi:hypothetical protein